MTSESLRDWERVKKYRILAKGLSPLPSDKAGSRLVDQQAYRGFIASGRKVTTDRIINKTRKHKNDYKEDIR
jgi:hypothetical protein